MRAVCGGCMNRCSLEEGQTGMCRARKNTGGAVIPVNYGKITSMALDPIEKKPLRRFLPGSVILSVGSFGCNLRCPFCQNHEISMAGEGDSHAVSVSPEELAQKAAELRKKGNIGVAYTYNEPLVGWEYIRDTGRLVRQAGMKNVIVTNGSVSDQVLDEILPVADAMNIDLKGFTENYYRKLGGDLETVKHFITRSSRECHVELTTLIVPGENDSDEEMREMAGWKWRCRMDFRYETVIPNDDLPFRMFIFEGRDGNYRVSKHWHQSVELFLVLEGTLDFFINSRQYTLKPNDFVIVNPNEIHSIECPAPNITIVLQIPMKSFEGYMSDESCITFADKGENQKARLVSLVTAMYRTYEQREFGYLLKVKSQFMEFLYLIVTEFRIEQIDKVQVRQKRHLDKLSQVTQYMKENYDKELSLEMVASRFGFTPSYLSHMFREYAQIGYRTYLMDLRVKYAMRELLNSDRYVGDIALDHGFADARAFAKAFKKRYGCLPSQYRKQMNQKQVNQKQINRKSLPDE